MTVINNIEIDHITYNRNDIKEAITNNDPIESKLHVVAVISNPCLYAIRYILMKEFMKRMESDEKNVILYVVELAYGKQQFLITDPKNPRHLQLRTKVPLWHKENMINVGIEKLLPPNWKAVAWIDADLEFENANWASDTLKVLNGSKDIVQLFSHCVDMDLHKNTMKMFSSFGYQYSKKKPYINSGPDFWHPGYAWACTRKAYDKMHGLFDQGILGSGDHIMALSLIGHVDKSANDKYSDGYKQSAREFQKRVAGLRLGYIPGVIRHHYHGSKKNRNYSERWEVLVRHNFDPELHLDYNKDGIIVPSKSFPDQFKQDILSYFAERNEDEDIPTIYDSDLKRSLSNNSITSVTSISSKNHVIKKKTDIVPYTNEQDISLYSQKEMIWYMMMFLGGASFVYLLMSISKM
jgi:hypothetical protein